MLVVEPVTPSAEEEGSGAAVGTEPAVSLRQELEALAARESAETTVSEAPASETVVEEIQPVATIQPITGGDILDLSAEQESWAEIVDANDIRLFYGMIKPGQALSLTGQAPFDVFLGNAPVVTMSLNSTNINMTKYIRSNNIAQFKISVEGGRVRFH